MTNWANWRIRWWRIRQRKCTQKTGILPVLTKK